MSYIDQLDDFMKERTERDPVYDWRKLYPRIDASEWRIWTDERGTFGFKTRGSFVGLTTFFVPRGWKPSNPEQVEGG